MTHALDADWRTAYPQHLADAGRGMARPGRLGGHDPGRRRRTARRGGRNRRARRGRHPRLGRRARRSAQPYDVDPTTPRACWRTSSSSTRQAPRACSDRRCRPPTTRRDLDRVVAMSGRDPGLAAGVTGHTGAMDPVVALRQIAYYKDRAREDSRRVMAYRNAADIVGGAQRSRARTPRRGQQLAVAARHRAEDGEGDRPGLGRPRTRRARRITFGCSRISAAAKSGPHCAATCTCTRTGPTGPRRSRR